MTITTAVRDEVLAGGDRAGAEELAAAIEDRWLEVVPTPTGTDRYPELAEGEAGTLLLALEYEGERIVLMDEAIGRARARALDLPVRATSCV